MKALSLVILIAILSLCVSAQAKTENVILVTIDGLRLQEMFGGLDEKLFKEINEDAENTAVFREFSSDTSKKRREKLMPFFWNVLMKNHGSIAGNPALNSSVQTTNNLLFSYPSYSEIFTGEARDKVIKSNKQIQNKFPSFFQFLQKKKKLNYNQVVSFATWEVMDQIVSNDSKAFLANAAYEELNSKDKNVRELYKLQFSTPTYWKRFRHDYYTFQLALAHTKRYKPRVLHIAFGETDKWAHTKNYERMIRSINRVDGFLKELWAFVRSNKRYRNKTTIIITTDHTRGNTKKNWYFHNKKTPEARNIWMAFISPNTNLRGEWKNSKTIYLNQIASTLCKYLGYNYLEQNPNAGKAIEQVFSK